MATTRTARYFTFYLGGTSIKLRRNDVTNEVIYLVVDVTEEDYRQRFRFYVGGHVSSLVGETFYVS
ncbi:transposase-like protein [Texcoconibacillus texcoconensis]|uniref:Transposase-like protein n=1 Tax=Texcoconibacillus texcoconensis TaxID=1095777 RepID=A0A840QRW0_9BACI|nr:transposase-like protein [Texcoconibacillus texcoconensis]